MSRRKKRRSCLGKRVYLSEHSEPFIGIDNLMAGLKAMISEAYFTNPVENEVYLVLLALPRMRFSLVSTRAEAALKRVLGVS